MNPVAVTALLMTACTLLVAGTTLIAKALGTGVMGDTLHPLMVSQARFVFGALAVSVALLAVRATGRRPWPVSGPPNWGLQALRSALGWISNVLVFAAVTQIALTDANALSFLSPFATMLIAIPVLGERPGRWRWLAAGLAFVGAVILLRPGAGVFQPAALLALGAAVLLGFELIAIKKLSGREAPLQILTINNGIGLCIASVAVLAVWAPPTAAQWAALAALGLMMALAQACFVNAMARADASYVAPFSYTTLVFAAGYDALVFGVRPDTVSWLGAGVILAGAGLLAWRQGRPARSAA